MEEANLSYIYSMSGGDKTFEKKIIDVIKKEFPLEKESYVTHLEAKNLESVAADVHKLKHKISILGLVKSYELAEQYENNLLNGSLELKSDFDTILQIMTDFLDTL